jgi:hypothetical protein
MLAAEAGVAPQNMCPARAPSTKVRAIATTRRILCLWNDWSNRLLHAKASNCLFVPAYAASGSGLDRRHTMFHAQRFLKDGIPPISVFEVVRHRRSAHQLRADFWPKVIR